MAANTFTPADLENMTWQAMADEIIRLRADLAKAVEAINAAEAAVQQKVEMWTDDDDLADWGPPGKTILADLLSVFSEIPHD